MINKKQINSNTSFIKLRLLYKKNIGTLQDYPKIYWFASQKVL